ncbi:exopolysaccharide biosynthesis polyprenyl glycosylphosphotransferase [Streptomyces sp. NBC_00853]|nr:exopolysaccharide biosynthesis polyprenyl glycosylphosphotransferase [Streptomyces sp. NBC_01207]WTA23448.1 exopolysaccharide biosynthesis polyprenyl glycosylphosphotransferase [Streptomyces sp. NBC_00853]
MDSAPARHTGQSGTGPTGAGAFAPVHPAAARRSATGIHPPRGPRTDQARSALRPRRVRRRGRALPLLTVDVLAAALTATTLPAAAPVLSAAPVLLAALHAQAGLYRPRLAPSALLELPVLAGRSAVLWCSVAAVTAAADPARAMGWSALLTAVCLQVVLACAGRGLVNELQRRSAVRRPASALVVGPSAGASAVAAALHGRPEFGLRPVGLADPAVGYAPAEGDGGALPLLATHEDIRRAVIQNSVGHAVFTRPPEADERTASLVRLFHDHGCRLWLADPAGTAKVTGMRVPHPADQLWGYAVQPLLPRPARPLERWAKRGIDTVLALIALLAAAPVMGACALAVRLWDGPGVIFRQERVGLYGRPFTLLKFRTLRADAHEAATRWTVAGDRGMSPVGSFLRKSSLDELPQLWNVVRGDMALVGPRPERPFFVAKFSTVHPGYEARHRMPVGITGLAQINGLRGDTSIEDRARFDNHYIDTWSLWQDLWILARTAASFFRFRLGGS